jgi:hypothetical protein
VAPVSNRFERFPVFQASGFAGGALTADALEEEHILGCGDFGRFFQQPRLAHAGFARYDHRRARALSGLGHALAQ